MRQIFETPGLAPGTAPNQGAASAVSGGGGEEDDGFWDDDMPWAAWHSLDDPVLGR
jgi:hypothetical protein